MMKIYLFLNNCIIIAIIANYVNLIACEKVNKTYSCGRQEVRKGRIVGGSDAFSGEFPWIASIFMNGQHYCGGVLIGNQWIIAAAHCVRGYVPKNFVIRLGAHSIQSQLEETAVDLSVESIIIHQNYSRPRPFSNDIALLKLKDKVRYTDYIIPICLPEAKDPDKSDTYNNMSGIVVGWGWLNENYKNEEDNLADILQKVKLPVISNKECELWYRSRGRFLTVFPTQFCAGFREGGKDACRGDSGGPLLLLNSTSNVYTLVGIVSAGIGCALPQLPGLYTRVDAYIPWIFRYISS